MATIHGGGGGGGGQKHVVRKYTNWFLSLLHVEVDPFRLKLQSCHYGNFQCGYKCVIQLSYPCDVISYKKENFVTMK